MKQLEELQKKILQVIQKNKELVEENKKLKLDNQDLHNKCKNLEDSLLEKSKTFEYLENEKTEIKSCLDDLINSIGSLEETNKEVNR